jgi:hypothetical protein
MSTRALWQLYQQSSSSKHEEREKEVMNLALRIIFVHTPQVISYIPQSLTTWGLRLYLTAYGSRDTDFSSQCATAHIGP